MHKQKKKTKEWSMCNSQFIMIYAILSTVITSEVAMFTTGTNFCSITWTDINFMRHWAFWGLFISPIDKSHSIGGHSSSAYMKFLASFWATGLWKK